MEGVKVDFCPQCRRRIDWALDNVPLRDIFIRADPDEPRPSEGHVVVPLCERCSRFVRSTLHVGGFTIHTL